MGILNAFLDLFRREKGGVIVKISWGEYFDKLSILSVKSMKVVPNTKVYFLVVDQYNMLYASMCRCETYDKVHNEYRRLQDINDRLWDLENEVRSDSIFDETVLSCYAQIRRLNKERHELKCKIDDILGCVKNKEIKQYAGQ